MNKVAVIMLTYNRPENIKHTIECIKKQTVKSFTFFVINNSYNNKDFFSEYFKTKETDISIEFFDNSNNNDSTSFYRFYFAQGLVDLGYSTFIMIDDDQSFGASFVEDCINKKEFGVFKSWWSYSIEGDYLEGRRKLNCDEVGNYAGPGGCVFGKDFFEIKKILDCPEKYKNMDDIWISHMMNKNNFLIKKLCTDISFMNDYEKKSLFEEYREKKILFWKYF